METATAHPYYHFDDHGSRAITADEWARFQAALPADVRLALPEHGAPLDRPPADLEYLIDVIRDYMMDYIYRCQRRPLLPHEREEYGEMGFMLTRKGAAKYEARLTELADAFETVFGLSVRRRGRNSPAEGPLDPISYE